MDDLETMRLGSLSSDVFELRTSTGSEPFPLLISLDTTVFILPSVLILTETICPKICSKSRLKSAKRPFPVDVRRSKTSLLKLPIVSITARVRSDGILYWNLAAILMIVFFHKSKVSLTV